ncbi:MAG: response regulator [Acidobacteria bacterium]|nr:response regulator [Acidobacteriota bacterium]
MELPEAHILLIEDNPGDADLVRLRLTEGQPNLRVECVPRLSDALESLSHGTPSLVLLDLNLPDSRGAETLRKIREKSPDVPVVVLSRQDDEGMASRALHQGVQDYLVKGDISGKQLERAMRHAMERQALLLSLEIASKQQLAFKNQFLSHVSHELRTPLTCIHQYVTLLLDGLAGPMIPEQSDHLKTVLKSVNQLHAMIRDLLEATRAESGSLRVEPRCISIDALIQQAVAMMRPAAHERQVALEIGPDAHIPLVYADPDRVLEILINLLDNAIKFTSAEGKVIVQACVTENDGQSVYVSVTDTGRGISPAAQALIFERLYQDPDSIDCNRKGLGLGLFICKELVRLHDGRIWVTSEPGQGSNFTFTLPLYSLARLLEPVLVYEGNLRTGLMLVRIDLAPLTEPPRGDWREAWQQCLETLRQCVYIDKDLVLPPMGESGAAETFFVVASTDMEHAGIMTMRIRKQLDRVADLKSRGKLTITTVPVERVLADSGQSVEKQVSAVAERVTEMIMLSMAGKHRPGNGVKHFN